MALFSKELGIDLGTVNTLVCEGGQVVLHEPTVVAIATAEAKIVAVGQEARDMYGRAPDSIEVMRPLRDGVIADYEVTQKLLEYVIAKVCGNLRLFRPRVIITVPYGVTSVESRAVVWIYLLLGVLIVILAMIATLFYLARPTEQDRHPLS